MNHSFDKIIKGYALFRKKYATGNKSVMKQLAFHGQQPEVMIVSCCDSRVDPSLILQCDPGDLFIVRNVANIIPPYESDDRHHGTSAALEFGVCYLNIKHLIILGHSQCGGIKALLDRLEGQRNDFISRWVDLIDRPAGVADADTMAKLAIFHSYQNCLTFPWIKGRVDQKTLAIHLWFFDIREGEILTFFFEERAFKRL